MKPSTIRLAAAMLALVLASLACSTSFSTANIADAYMTNDPQSKQAVTYFYPDETFYCIVDLRNAPNDTQVSAVWTAVKVDGAEPNLYLDEVSATTGSDILTFKLANDYLWPTGRYKVDIYLNGKIERTIEFDVIE